MPRKPCSTKRLRSTRTTLVAICVEAVELLAISWMQWRYMDTPPLSAAAKVMIGGALVFAVGVLIGSS
jgi:hypothetical protein